MQRAEFVGTFANVSWGHWLLTQFLEVTSSAFSRHICNKLCQIGNDFEVSLMEAGKVMLLLIWQLDIKPLNYKYWLDADPVQNCFSPARHSERASLCNLFTRVCASGSYRWTLSRMRCLRLACLVCLRPEELISDITIWKESRQVAPGVHRLYVD